MTESAPAMRIRFAQEYVDDASRDKDTCTTASQLSLLAGLVQAQIASAEATRITSIQLMNLAAAIQTQTQLMFALRGHKLSTEAREHFKEVLGCEE